jgi:hypothetical protein
MESKAAALLCYFKLRELRMLRDYAWHEKGTNNPPWLVLRKKLMDQSGSSVCDMSTAIAQVSEAGSRNQHDLLVQWKAVEDLANEARYGALNILRKQISRAQRVLVSKKTDKKFPNPGSLKKLKGYMEEWYTMQTMMYKAVAAVQKVKDAAKLGHRRANEFKKWDAKRHEAGYQTSQDYSPWLDLTSHMRAAGILKESSSTQFVGEAADGSIQAKEARPFENEDFTKTYGIEINMPLAELTEKMATFAAKREYFVEVQDLELAATLPELIAEVEGHNSQLEKHISPLRTNNETMESADPESLTGGQIQNVQKALKTTRARIADVLDESTVVAKKIQSAISGTANELPYTTIFWSSISDRKYTDSWPDFVTHMSMGPRMGRDQYFSPDLDFFEANAHNWNESIFYGNDSIEEGINVKRDRKAPRKIEKDAVFGKLKDSTAEEETLKLWNDVQQDNDDIGRKEFMANEDFKKIIEAHRVKQHYLNFIDEVAGKEKTQSKKTKAVSAPVSIVASESTHEEVRA